MSSLNVIMILPSSRSSVNESISGVTRSALCSVTLKTLASIFISEMSFTALADISRNVESMSIAKPGLSLILFSTSGVNVIVTIVDIISDLVPLRTTLCVSLSLILSNDRSSVDGSTGSSNVITMLIGSTTKITSNPVTTGGLSSGINWAGRIASLNDNPVSLLPTMSSVALSLIARKTVVFDTAN